MTTSSELISEKAATGIEGLDDILDGGAAIRESRISSKGITIGKPLEAFQGVLRGDPTYLGADTPLLREEIP